MKKKARTAFSRAQTQTLEAQFRKQVTCALTTILSTTSKLANLYSFLNLFLSRIISNANIAIIFGEELKSIYLYSTVLCYISLIYEF